MIARYGIGLGFVFAVLVSIGMAVAGEMTVEQARNLPGVVKVTRGDGSIAYFRDYNDYNENRPVAVESSSTISADGSGAVGGAYPAGSDGTGELSDEDIMRMVRQQYSGESRFSPEHIRSTIGSSQMWGLD